MPATWTPTAASEVAPGATVQLTDGRELEVTRIEQDFFGVPGLLAFIEDTPRQWFKAVVPGDQAIDVQVSG